MTSPAGYWVIASCAAVYRFGASTSISTTPIRTCTFHRFAVPGAVATSTGGAGTVTTGASSNSSVIVGVSGTSSTSTGTSTGSDWGTYFRWDVVWEGDEIAPLIARGVMHSPPNQLA